MRLKSINSFEYVPACKYCIKIFDGTHESPNPLTSGTHKLLTSQNILNGVINQDQAYFISNEDYISIQKRSAVLKGDVLFSMIGTVGNICYVDKEPNYAIKNMGCFRCRSDSDSKWLIYYFQSELGKANIKKAMNGSIQKYITLDKLTYFPILKQPLNYLRIINTLSKIDEQIKRNNEMVHKLQSFKPASFLSALGGYSYAS